MKQSKTNNRRVVKPEDLNRFRIVSDPQIAPDGSRVAFVEKRVAAPNGYKTNLLLAETNGRVRQFTDGDSDRLPRWSPDGSRIAFVRSPEEGQSQIYTIGLSGGEALKLTSFPEGSIGRFLWSPNGKWLAASFRVNDAERTLREQNLRKEQGLSDPPWVIDDLYYRLDGDGYFVRRHYALYLIDLASGAHRLLYGKHTGGEISFDFSPDSRQLAVATTRCKTPTLQPWKDELLRIDVSKGTIAQIPGLPPGPKLAVRWSPDGRTLAYAGRIGKDPAYSTENLELFVCDAVRGRPRSLTAEHDLCLEAEGITDSGPGFGDSKLQFSKNGARIYMRLSVRGESHITSIPVRGGPPHFHTHGQLDVRMGNISRDGRTMALTVGKATALAEVAVLDCEPIATSQQRNPSRLPAPIACRRDSRAGKGAAFLGKVWEKTGGRVPQALSARPVRKTESTAQRICPAKPKVLTKLNAPLLAELKIAEPRPVWIKAADGHRVQLWVVRPPNAPRSSKKPMPALLQIHGGPHSGYCSSFFHEFQVLASAGYTVFYSNPRGSKGYGRDHCAAIRGQWGTHDWTDLQAVIRFMQQQPYVDRRRMGVIGGSYGGYMTNWIISHCNDFAAAVTDRCISNLVSWSGSTDVVEEVDYYYPGNFWDQADSRWNRSPMKYLSNVKTPTLVIHSEGDLRCNIEQAEQLYSALKVMGVPARFVRYPACTSHGMSRNGPPDLRIHRLHQILAWWRKYLERK